MPLPNSLVDEWLQRADVLRSGHANASVDVQARDQVRLVHTICITGM
jgi:hypothetical protein